MLDDTNDITLNNWLNSGQDDNTHANLTIALMSRDNNSSIASDLNSMWSVPDKYLLTKEAYSDYDRCGLSDNNSETYIEKGFSAHTNDKSYDATPEECMTKGN